ncbi:hypothetical protein C4J98_3379 [Pseudomonas orientalis]|uniref:hypothetical protein n=1 Tax=Pseudomonas orientalis TaxID=76758 RepID=UPI000F573461|nr:hypothetical protein [Pseudomonas orientalis]AZE84785.1 hypothetical protein C4J98_3379 [Pseudomonas orientalis]
MQYEVFETSLEMQRAACGFPVSVAAVASIFDEHFPGFPIVPGAFTVGFVLACCRTLMPGIAFKVKRVVFIEPIEPGTRLNLQLPGLDRPELKEIGFILKSDRSIHCRGSVMYE